MAEVVSLQHIGNLYLFILLHEICFFACRNIWYLIGYSPNHNAC